MSDDYDKPGFIVHLGFHTQERIEPADSCPDWLRLPYYSAPVFQEILGFYQLVGNLGYGIVRWAKTAHEALGILYEKHREEAARMTRYQLYLMESASA